jgi:hypothetical protein
VMATFASGFLHCCRLGRKQKNQAEEICYEYVGCTIQMTSGYVTFTEIKFMS